MRKEEKNLVIINPLGACLIKLRKKRVQETFSCLESITLEKIHKHSLQGRDKIMQDIKKPNRQIGLRDQRAKTEESHYEIVVDITGGWEEDKNYKISQTMGHDKGSE